MALKRAAWYAAHRAQVIAENSAYQKAHPEVNKAASAKWRKANPTYTADYRARHPGDALAASLKWKKAHPEKAKGSASKASAKWRKTHPGKTVAASIKWQNEHPEAAKAATKKYLKTRKEKAAGRKKPKCCEVCKKSDRRICFDHCHKSQKFRGWICSNCNSALGHTKDDPKLLRKLAAYVEQPLKYRITYKGGGYMKKADRALIGPRPDKCQVCKQAGKICMDHCHKKSLFRGWLCHNCNCALGYVHDSPKLLRALADYLETAKERVKEKKGTARRKK